MQIMTHRIWHVQLNSRVLIAFNIKGHLVLKIDFEVLFIPFERGNKYFQILFKDYIIKRDAISNGAKKINQNESWPHWEWPKWNLTSLSTGLSSSSRAASYSFCMYVVILALATSDMIKRLKCEVYKKIMPDVSHYTRYGYINHFFNFLAFMYTIFFALTIIDMILWQKLIEVRLKSILYNIFLAKVAPL